MVVETGKTNIYREVFPNVLRTMRKQKKLTQEQLAERADIATRYVQHLEAGEHQPTISTFCDIAYAMGMSPDELMLEFVKKLPERK